MNVKSHLTRILLVISLAQILLFLGCPEGTSPSPPPPCSPAINCVVFEETGDFCCGAVFPERRTWVAKNIHPTKSIIAVVIPKIAKYEGTGIVGWKEDTDNIELIRLSPNGGNKQLKCGWTHLDAAPNICFRYRVYNTAKACFADDPMCQTPTSPSNPGLPPFNCLNACKDGDAHCLKVPYADFNAKEQRALLELRRGLQLGRPPYTFGPGVAQSIFFASAEKCGERITQLLYDNKTTFHSMGSTCTSNPLLPRPVPLIGTPFYYSSLWVKVPPVIEGDLYRQHDLAEVRFFYDQVQSPWITVKLDVPTPDNTRQDVLKALTVTNHAGAHANIVLSGKDFACVAISDVPNVDGIAN